MAQSDDASRPFLSDTNNDHDDYTSSEPLNSFSNSHLEDGYPSKSEATTSVLSNWWSRGWKMTSRAKQKFEDDENAMLMQNMGLKPMGPRRPKSFYSWFVFGSASGLSILAILLSANLLMTAATLYWADDWETPLSNWGAAGTTSEGLSWYPTNFLRDVTPIPCHSHNDYWRRVPLFSALHAGCTGVEADVWLFDNELYVGHNTASLARNRTFSSLYIKPLVDILDRQNPTTDFYNGSSHGVFDSSPETSLTLLVDLKTAGPETWPVVLAQLEPLRRRDWLTFVRDGVVHQRPITVVGTGNTPFNLLTANATYRDAFFDAPLDSMWEPALVDGGGEERSGDDSEEEEAEAEAEAALHRDLGQGKSGTSPSDVYDASNSYYASVSFGVAVGRMWRERLTAEQMKIIRGQVRGAHARGLKVRYWNLPAWPVALRNHVWDVLVKEGVDMLNVDDLRGVSRRVW